MERLLNFIDGEYRAPSTNKWLEKLDPTTDEALYELPDSNEMDVIQAISSSSKAFEKWSSTPAEERAQILFRIADLIDENLEALALAESEDVGKPLSLARTLDIPRASQNFRFFASKIIHKVETASDMDGKAINYVLRQPIGVAALIAPWNLPLYLMTWKIAPCLATGNVAVCKPSEFTSKTCFLMGEIFNQAGLPKGVCNIVLGLGDPVGKTLVEHPGVPLISFTGGTKTGELVQKQSLGHFKKLSLELGGKNATLVLKDADLKKVVPAVLRSSFLNQGEICLCGSKILVQEDIFEEFCRVFSEAASKLVVGDPKDEKTFMGPLVSKAHYEKVKSFIELAKREDGRILTGGDVPEGLPDSMKRGYFLRPTVVKDLTNCSEIHQTEIFGPVVTVNSFKYLHEGVKWANTSPYGLSASVWTNDLSKAHKAARDLKVGTVWINTWLKRDLRMPFGGQKASGIGREGGEDSLDFFTEKKTVCIEL